MTNQISKKTALLFLVLMLGISSVPVSSYAHDNGKGRNDDKNENKSERNEREDNHKKNKDKKIERKENKVCRQIFKRLFNRGFFQNQSDIDAFLECLRPFGIDGRFGGNATGTPDTTSPVISDLSVKPNTVKAEVKWHTNEKSDSQVFWSTSSNVDLNSSSTASTTRSEKVKDHNVVIENLNASTTYYLVVRSKDASSNSTTSNEISFTTKSLSLDTTSPIISGIGLLLGTSTANVSWHTNENASSRVYYGNSASLDVNASTTSFFENSTLKQNHSISVNGLATSTLYYFAIESKDGSGNRTVTPVFSGSTGL